MSAKDSKKGGLVRNKVLPQFKLESVPLVSDRGKIFRRISVVRIFPRVKGRQIRTHLRSSRGKQWKTQAGADST